MQNTQLFYSLEQKPPFFKAIFAAFVHLMAMFIAVITPSLLICKELGVNDMDTGRIIAMSLFASGIASLIQIYKIGPIGSGLLSIQGTSFNFVAPIITAGLLLKNKGLDDAQMLGTIFGTLMMCALTEILISQFLPLFKKAISPLVSGIVVLLIGLSLINIGLISVGGGYEAKSNGSFGNLKDLFLAGSVIATIIFLNLFKNSYLKISALFLAVVIGVLIAYFLGDFSFQMNHQLPLVFLPQPFYFGIGIDWSLVLPFVLVYAVTSLETIGDISATCEVSHQKLEGREYFLRLKGGVLANGINSFVSGIFNTFPNSCFSQNNGVIALSGIASRYVGLLVALFLMLLGLFPVIANFALQIPQSILGGATLVMFGSIAATGVRILAKEKITRRSILIISLSLGIGLGVNNNPDILQFLPKWVESVFSSGIVAGGLCAIFLNLIFPKEVV